MFKWLNSFKETTAQTKYFILTIAAYGLMLVATTVYVYGRLDFVRSYKHTPAAEPLQNNYDNASPRILQK